MTATVMMMRFVSVFFLKFVFNELFVKSGFLQDDDSPSLQFQVGRTVTLQMLLAAKLLEPGASAMTIEYLVRQSTLFILENGKCSVFNDQS